MESERQEYISDDKEENFFVVGHRDGDATPVLLAAVSTRRSAQRYQAMFQEHLEGYVQISVDVATGLSPWEQRKKAARKRARLRGVA